MPWDKTNKQDREVCTKREQFQEFEHLSSLIITEEVDQVKRMTGCLTPCSYKEYKLMLSVPKDFVLAVVPDDQIAVGLWAASWSTEFREEVSVTLNDITKVQKLTLSLF